ncbi:hypothetical protein V5O48_002594 [Marasmius crinis-equi]|uniref:Uncharacterized protein n=1 Tax=Marasmius crinis-equi TaxID=585013 RepID=A0ABR3FV89_9AGAR
MQDTNIAAKHPPAVTQESKTDTVDDYPRPSAPGDNNSEHAHHSYEEESPLKREMKKHVHKNIPDNQPTRDFQTSSKGQGYGAGGRIAQPSAGRVGV